MALLVYAVGGALIAGSIGGWAVRDAFADAAAAKGYERLLKVKDENQEELRAEAGRYETFRSSIEPGTNTVREKIREYYRNAPPVLAECAWSPDVLGLLENHRAVANRAAGGQFESAVPADTADPGE